MAAANFLNSRSLAPNPSCLCRLAFERKWRGQRIPIEELYEAYFDEKVDLIDGDASLLDVLYQRHEFARSILTMSHVKFFLLQFIPELLKHTRFQDITQVREHYDRSVEVKQAAALCCLSFRSIALFPPS